MSNYKDIHGTQIEVRSDNPSNPVNGQVWYNTTDSKLRGLAISPVGSWATGGNLNTARQGLAGAGTKAAGLAFGGVGGGPTNQAQDATEKYNGTAWTEVNNLNTARGFTGGTGTQWYGLFCKGNACY